jgi:hypothetical protein
MSPERRTSALKAPFAAGTTPPGPIQGAICALDRPWGNLCSERAPLEQRTSESAMRSKRDAESVATVTGALLHIGSLTRAPQIRKTGPSSRAWTERHCPGCSQGGLVAAE